MKELEKYSLSDLSAIENKLKEKLPLRPYPGDFKNYEIQLPIWEEENKETLYMIAIINKEIIDRLESMRMKIIEQIKSEIGE